MISQYLPLLKSLAVVVFIVSMLSAKYHANRMKSIKEKDQSGTNEIAAISGVVDTVLYADHKVYLHAKHADGHEMWVATAEQTVDKGDLVSFEWTVPSYTHYSKGLRRTFPEIFFVSRIHVHRQV